MLISIQDFSQWMNGKLVSGDATKEITGAVFDTREIKDGNVFFAFQGEKSDGHAFLAQAEQAGAVAVVVRQDRLDGLNMPLHAAVIAVADVELALGNAAAKYRRLFTPVVTAVTGSVGKTTTREMICCALSSKEKTFTNKKNFNNEIGVPMTLFEIDKEHTAGVVEMGMRGHGQIEYLCNIADPQIGVITNVGYSHIELLGSQDGIADAKYELFDYLAGKEKACAIYNGDDPYLASRAERLPKHVKCVSFGMMAQNDVVVIKYDADAKGGSVVEYSVHGKRIKLVWQQSGVHNAINGAAALAVAAEYGVSAEEAVANLARFTGVPMRLDACTLSNGALLVNDAYNASPDSTLALLGWVGEREAERKILVFGDMLELGDYSQELHTLIGQEAAEVADILISIGEMAYIAADAYAKEKLAQPVFKMASNQEAVKWLKENIIDGDLVVLKASRGMHFEEIAAALK